MGTEQKAGQGIAGDPRLTGEGRHSYEDFTQRPFYKKINRETISLAPAGIRSVLDIATGTGGIIDILLEEKKINYFDTIHGIDLDGAALVEAKKKFDERKYPLSMGGITFGKASAESTGEISNMYNLVTFCNAIHLTDVPNSLIEAYRVLEPGGTFLSNSAFVDGVGYPTSEAEILWRSLGAGAIRKSMKIGHRPEKNTDFVNHTVEDYKMFAVNAGFMDVNTSIIEARMDMDDVLAICHYDEFAKGVLKGVPLHIAHAVLSDTAKEIFARLEKEGKEAVFPRNWMVLSAKK